MNINLPHPLEGVSVVEAKAIQSNLADRVSFDDDPRLAEIRLVAGIDNSYLQTAAQTTAFAAVVLMRWPELEEVEVATASREVTFPYVPGLLSFRELPVVVAALEALAGAPDVIFCDGHGLAHPRRFGIACHVGLLTGLPTIGCAKRPLFAKYEDPERELGARTLMTMNGEPVGVALRTSARRTLPLFVSPGNQVSIDTAADLALAAARGSYLPVPQQGAHDTVTRWRAERKGA
jgi:deoxyribonuclease V